MCKECLHTLMSEYCIVVLLMLYCILNKVGEMGVGEQGISLYEFHENAKPKKKRKIDM